MNTKVLEKLGKQLKSFRLDRDLTQEELADKVGIHPTYVGKLETGKSNPSVKMLFKISRALNVKLHELFLFDK